MAKNTKSKKEQGKSAKTGNLQTPNMGDSFAIAVGALVQESKNMKGSQSGFLGVPKETIDVKEFNNSLTGKK